uniref:Xanthine/uracil/vitamin C permease n=1 Tax=Aplanochytrium stocchinoi TaxID=215587 RepID=A0A7S3LN44_9STRA|mmetsp:Transcript_4926/g.5771  ORF Transcript_4926/g.5771 Transcript_4926/m.5771 type:complete len:527 (-) Transcript_4926:377-1957(-)
MSGERSAATSSGTGYGAINNNKVKGVNGVGKHHKNVERSFLTRVFELDTRNTTVAKEFRAGTTSFLTMAYILLVNPEILGTPHTGIARGDVVIGTALASAFASFIVGFFGNLPFGCAPGLGLSAYLSYGLVQGRGIPWQGALTTCVVTGAIMLLLAITRLSDLMMSFIPRTIKSATVVGMGLLLSFIGMQTIHVVVAADDDSLIKLGPLDNWEVWLSLIGLILLATLTYHHVRGAVLIGIFVLTMILWQSDNSWPDKIIEIPNTERANSIFQASLSFDLIDESYIPGILAFLSVGIFDVSGVMYACSRLANLQDKETGETPGGKWAFIATALGTIVAGLLGCSPIIIHLESVAGIKEGGRTGLTACVISFWFLVSVLFAPLFGDIPVYATAPVLLLIGSMMMGEASEINWRSMYEAVPAFLTLAMMPLTFSIPNGIFFGTVSHILLYITTGEFFTWFKEYFFSRSIRRYDSFEEATKLTTQGGDIEDNNNRKVAEKIPSFFGVEPYERSPSLLLRQEEYDFEDQGF